MPGYKTTVLIQPQYITFDKQHNRILILDKVVYVLFTTRILILDKVVYVLFTDRFLMYQIDIKTGLPSERT